MPAIKKRINAVVWPSKIVTTVKMNMGNCDQRDRRGDAGNGFPQQGGQSEDQVGAEARARLHAPAAGNSPEAPMPRRSAWRTTGR